MVGFLFAPPELELTKAQILESIPRYHWLTGPHLDIFCIGYGRWVPESESVKRVYRGGDGGETWRFDEQAFQEFVNVVESASTWQYSQGVELVLTNASFNPFDDTTSLDFSHAVTVQLDKLVKHQDQNARWSVGNLLGRLVRFAKSSNGMDPTWRVRRDLITSGVGNSVYYVTISLLPKWVGTIIDAGKTLLEGAVRIIGPRK